MNMTKEGDYTWNMYCLSFMVTVGAALLLLAAGVLPVGGVDGGTITVDDDGGADYDTIQDAVDNAGDGDTIRVWDGTYRETVLIDRRITLEGNGSSRTVIDGEEVGDVVIVTSNEVNMSGFTVSGSDILDDGIRVDGDNCNIFDNNCLDNFIGIHLYDSENCTVKNNTCNNNTFYGINIERSTNNVIFNNNCSNNDVLGIRIARSEFNILDFNICSDNTDFGVGIYESQWISVFNATLTGNDYGLKLWKSSNCSIENSSLYSNTIGILAENSSEDNRARNNSIYDNSQYGILVSDNSNHTIDARYNWWGFYSGPFHTTLNPNGSANRVGEDVDFDPWQGKGILGKPVAHIDFISPNPAITNEPIQFGANGTGDGASVSRYAWRSNMDGEFYNGTDNRIEYGNLSTGTHSISLKVMDRRGLWSEEMKSDLKVHMRPHIESVATNVNDTALFDAGGHYLEEINFSVEVIDDGEIVLYEWHSSLDGILYSGNSSSFTIRYQSQLSGGQHTISVRVRDDLDVWSQEVEFFLLSVLNTSYNRKPIIILNSPNDNSLVNNIMNSTLNMTVWDPDGHNINMEFSIDNGYWTILDHSSRIYNGTRLELEYFLGDIETGPHSFHIRAYDGEVYSDTVYLNVTKVDSIFDLNVSWYSIGKYLQVGGEVRIYVSILKSEKGTVPPINIMVYLGNDVYRKEVISDSVTNYNTQSSYVVALYFRVKTQHQGLDRIIVIADPDKTIVDPDRTNNEIVYMIEPIEAASEDEDDDDSAGFHISLLLGGLSVALFVAALHRKKG